MLAQVPKLPGLLTLAGQRTALEAVHECHGALLRRETLGRSTEGRAIEMHSVGSGARAVLVVGGPHPNEPVGGLTAVSLLHALAVDSARWEPLDCTFHFIPCIDPDGLERNAPWIAQPLSLTAYLEDFFRPALRLQPEYSFPLEVGSYRFNTPTPENLAWQEALKRTQPALQLSLHNADLGGAFFLMSADRPQLAERLRQLTAIHGLALSNVGEPLAELPPHSPGVFGFPAIEALFDSAATGASTGAWNAGDSSEGFGRRFGTFSLVPEVPLWTAQAPDGPRATATALSDILTSHLARCHQLAELLAARLPACIARAKHGDSPWVAALHEIDQQTSRQQNLLGAMLSRAHPSLQEALPVPDAISIEAQLTMFFLRGASMLRSLARRTNRELAAADCGALIAEGIFRLEQIAGLVPSNLQHLVAVQAGAILLGASER